MGKMKELELQKQQEQELLEKYAAAYGISIKKFKKERKAC